MAKPDRHFINVFSAVLGVLIAVALRAREVRNRARDALDPVTRARRKSKAA